MAKKTYAADEVTLVQGAIQNAKEPRHFMVIEPVEAELVVHCRGKELARSSRAFLVKEIGKQIMDPVIYFHRDDVRMDRLSKSSLQTDCPLKGKASYYDSKETGAISVAWSYEQTETGGAQQLKDRLAFDAAQVLLDVGGG